MVSSDALGASANTEPPFIFLKGAEKVLQGDTNWEDGARAVRQNLSDAMNARHVAFLFGSGCSSHVARGSQVGIHTMQPLAREFTTTIKDSKDEQFITKLEQEFLAESLGIDLAEYSTNLEKLMETLHCFRFALSRSSIQTDREASVGAEAIIGKLQRFLLERCVNGEFSRGDDTVNGFYEMFYRKLVYRDRSLPRPWIFTTNYDLFNETAMDRLVVPYCNGFTGIVERRFSPAVFRYALAEQMDVTSRKWSAVDGYVYLCKLHGSVSWIERGSGLFPIMEVQKPDPRNVGKVMIYPTPAKQGASLSSPYADLFREFRSRIVNEQSVLFTLGYSFGDEHVNNIIYQALTIPTFRLIVFADPNAPGDIQKLRKLGDPRIWFIGSGDSCAGKMAHYFETFVKEFMPEPPGDRIDTAVRRVLTDLIGATADHGDGNGR